MIGIDDIPGPPLDLSGGYANDCGGYQIVGHRLEFVGLCPACKQRMHGLDGGSPLRSANEYGGRANTVHSHTERTPNMLSAKIQEALNQQINAEAYSSYLYLSMSAYFEAQSLKGMAHWMRVQTEEERRTR